MRVVVDVQMIAADHVQMIAADLVRMIAADHVQMIAAVVNREVGGEGVPMIVVQVVPEDQVVRGSAQTAEVGVISEGAGLDHSVVMEALSAVVSLPLVMSVNH